MLIILPVISLAAVGFLSIRQDREMAEAEARQRANELADSIVSAMQLHFGLSSSDPFIDRVLRMLPDRNASSIADPIQLRASSSGGADFKIAIIGQSNELVYPPPLRLVPMPSSEAQKLTGEQSNLWSQLIASEFVQRDLSNTVEVANHFLKTKPPKICATRLTYEIGTILNKSGQWRKALEYFVPLAFGDTEADSLTEAGIPLRQLALWHLATLASSNKESEQAVLAAWNNYSAKKTATRGDAAANLSQTGLLWNRLCYEAVMNPTVLSEYLLTEALARTQPADKPVIGEWLGVWTSHELSREVYARLVQSRSYRSNELSGWRSDDRWVGRVDGPVASNRVLFAVSRVQILQDVGKMLKNMGASETKTMLHFGKPSATRRNYLFMSPSDLDSAQWAYPAVFLPPLWMPPYFEVAVSLDSNAYTKVNDFDPLLAERHGESQENPLYVAENIMNEEVKKRLGESQDNRGHVFGAPGEFQPVSSTMFDFELKVWGVPIAIFAHQRQRALIFGSLVAAAAIAALVGFFAARRAFHRQLHLSEMKSNFVSSVSHELRAPIASVRLMAEGLERGKVQDAQKQNEYFRFIVQECRRLSSLIENVLDFSRIEQGRKQYEFEPTDAVILAQQTVKLMDTYAAERQIKLALQITGAPFPFEMDGKAIQQALINLLDNAIKHSPKGSVVTVGLEFDEPSAGSDLCLWVEDRGEGIPPEEHEKIFERFYRLGSELRRETQGVGIGLSIVKHIVQAHGGEIQVRSAPGQGSRFTIELPAKKEQS
ncbi:MAG TPA: HAMP domain-containing sensor histidine kinase [Verrucomicrobiae bacterium]|nr:HAMP domain-containing sensor histidine kinase [Verrucomicrobiae bacterium]